VGLARNPSIPLPLITSSIATPDCWPQYTYEPLKSSHLKPSRRTSNCFLLNHVQLLPHFSHYSIALNLIFTAYTLLSPTFPNCLSSLQQWNLRPARWGITIHRRIKKHALREHSHSRWQSMFIDHRMFNSNNQPSCIILQMSDVADITNEAAWRYWSGHWWWWKWGHWNDYLIFQHRRRRFGSRAAAPTFTPGTPGQVTTHYKGSSVPEMEQCQYCHCTPSASKFPKPTWVIGTTTAQKPKVILPQQIILVWQCTICPGAAATQV